MLTVSGGLTSSGACLADVYNVVLKQAKKRALVDAVLTATAASDLFTQDLEDLSSVVEVAAAALSVQIGSGL